MKPTHAGKKDLWRKESGNGGNLFVRCPCVLQCGLPKAVDIQLCNMACKSPLSRSNSQRHMAQKWVGGVWLKDVDSRDVLRVCVCAADIDIPCAAEAEASVFKVSGDGK